MLERTVMAHCASFPLYLCSCQACYERRHFSALRRHSGLMAHRHTFRSKSMSSALVELFPSPLWQQMIKNPVPHDKSGKPKSRGISIAHQTERNVNFINWCDVFFDRVLQKQKHSPHSLKN